ncbi:MAG: TRAP transporter large permease subunit [Candidatus Methylomirabilales bacterium]
MSESVVEVVAARDSAPPVDRRWVHVADEILRWTTEVPVALLVLVEFVLLLMGVVARYAFHRPLYWVDELAATLFLWLGMLGAAVALRRGEHMRLTAFVRRGSPAARAWVDVAVMVVVGTFALEMLGPTRAFVVAEAAITMPALQVSAAYGVAAVLVGMVLMLIIVFVRLARAASLRMCVSAVALVGGMSLLAIAAKPLLIRLGNVNLILFFVVLVGLFVSSSVPIAFGFGVATLSYLALTTAMPLSVVVGRMAEGMSALVLLAVPLFVLLGLLIDMTGITNALIDFIAALIGHVRGGLGYVLLVAMYFVSGISGSKAADMAAVAPVLFPVMKRRGWEPGELVGMLSASGAMGETIPPSLVVIIIGSVTGVSIAALFTGGLLPAAVAALSMAAIVFVRSGGRDRGAARPAVVAILKKFLVAFPALVLPFLVLGAVIEGIATATEVSTVGIAYAGLIGVVVYRRFEWRRVYPMLVETASLSGAILLIIATATAMAWALTQSGFSQALVRMMAGVPGGRAGFLAASVVVFVVLGSFLEGIPAVVLFGPLLFPVSRIMGVHDVHYAMVVILGMGVGLFSPPFGVGFYAACAIGKVSPDDAMGRVFPYMAAVLAALIVVAAIPWLSIGFLQAR